MYGPKIVNRVSLTVQSAVAASLYLAFYGGLLPGLFSEWYNSSIYSYGFLVPVIAVYLAWLKIPEIRSIRIDPTLWGVLPLLVSLALYFVGELLSDDFVMRISMVLSLISIAQIILGTRVVKVLAFPFSYLTLMIPIPYFFVKEVVNWLMFFDASQAAKIVQSFGLPVFIDSNYIHLPNIVLEVADVCSGITSLLAILVLGIMYAYLLPVSFALKVALVASAVPIAILINLSRIIVTVLLTYNFGPVVLDSLVHKFHGTFNFLLSLFLLLLVGETLRRRSGGVYLLRNADDQSTCYERASPTRWLAFAVSIAIFSVAIWLSGTLTAAAQSVTHIDLDRLPLSLAESLVRPISWPDQYVDTKAKYSIARVYADNLNTPIELFIGYGGAVGGANRLQSPRLILPLNWNSIWIQSEEIDISPKGKLDVNWMLTQRSNSKRLVLYWYQSGRKVFSGELQFRLQILNSRISDPGRGIAVVRIATSVNEDDGVERARQRVRLFAQRLYPELTRILLP